MNRMKLLSITVASVGAIAAMVIMVGGMNRSRGPLLDAPAIIELGEREHGAIATATFTVHNSGDSELLLSDFQVSDCICCNVFEVESQGHKTPLRELRLAGGQSAEIHFRKAVKGNASEPTHSFITFHTNIPSQPEAKISVTVANVLAGVTATPAQWAVGEIPLGRNARQKFTLTDSSATPRPIERVESSDPARLKAKMLPSGKLVVEVETDRPGPVNGSVRLYVLGGKAEPDPIKITGRVVAPVECSPAAVRLPRRSSDGPLYHASCLIQATGGQPLELRLADLPEGIKAEVNPNESGARQTQVVKISVDRNLPPSQRTVRLLAATGDWSGEIQIPVEITVKEGS
jgi:hypothetical protein